MVLQYCKRWMASNVPKEKGLSPKKITGKMTRETEASRATIYLILRLIPNSVLSCIVLKNDV